VQLKVGGEVRKKLTVGVDLPVRAMTLRAETQLAEAGLPLNMEVKSKQLYWPFTGEKAVPGRRSLLKFNGKMTDYTLALAPR
jgi:translocation and assembly module TamB